VELPQKLLTAAAAYDGLHGKRFEKLKISLIFFAFLTARSTRRTTPRYAKSFFANSAGRVQGIEKTKNRWAVFCFGKLRVTPIYKHQLQGFVYSKVFLFYAPIFRFFIPKSWGVTTLQWNC
jgi:glycosyltransferase involved in cell wall biosynthesis